MTRRRTSLALIRGTPSILALLLLLAAGGLAGAQSAHGAVDDTIAAVGPRVVKIYGAGGFRGLEAYQSGFLVSPEGHIVTVWSYVLDTDYITVTLDDGRKFEAKLLGADPHLEVAVLKIEAADLPCFDLGQAVEGDAGTRVLAFSNLFGVATGNEPASVQHGIVSVKTSLAARRGSFETPYDGSVYVLDAGTNNPGAAGGALVTRAGGLLGMLGKELRNSGNNTWLNYAIPAPEFRQSVDQIRAGKFVPRDPEGEDELRKPDRALTLSLLGIILVPDVMERTPPYIDQVRSGTPAAAEGLLPDDLVVLLGDHLIQSCKALRAELEYIDYEDAVRLTVLRDQVLREILLQASPESGDERP